MQNTHPTIHHSFMQHSFKQIYTENLFNSKDRMINKISPSLQETLTCSLYWLEKNFEWHRNMWIYKTRPLVSRTLLYYKETNNCKSRKVIINTMKKKVVLHRENREYLFFYVSLQNISLKEGSFFLRNPKMRLLSHFSYLSWVIMPSWEPDLCLRECHAYVG